jgi:hypothetical protein
MDNFSAADCEYGPLPAGMLGRQVDPRFPYNLFLRELPRSLMYGGMADKIILST